MLFTFFYMSFTCFLHVFYMSFTWQFYQCKSLEPKWFEPTPPRGLFRALFRLARECKLLDPAQTGLRCYGLLWPLTILLSSLHRTSREPKTLKPAPALARLLLRVPIPSQCTPTAHPPRVSITSGSSLEVVAAPGFGS